MSNIPVSTMAAALTLDVAGYAAGVKQAESLSRRLAKAQAEALGGPGLRSAGGQDLAQQVARAQELRARAELRAQQLRSAVMTPEGMGRFVPKASDLQGPIRLRQSAVDAELSAEMAKRVAQSQARVALERQTQQSLEAVREQSASRASEIHFGAADPTSVERSNAAQREFNKLLGVSYTRINAVEAAAESAFNDLPTDIERSNAAQREFNKLLGVSYTRINAVEAAAESAFNQLPADFETLSDKSRQAAYSMHSVGNTALDTQERMRTLNLRILQGGYQLQDFVVQVGAGQNALVAFAQQSAQMAGFFGTTGAWVGVGLAVAAIATNMFLLSNNTKDATKEVKSLRDETDGLIKARRELLEITMGEKAERAFASGDVKAAEADVRNAKKIVDMADAAAARRRGPLGLIAPGKRDEFGREIDPKAEGATEAQRAALVAAETALVEARKKSAQVFGETAEATKKATEANQEYEKSVRDARRENMQFGETSIQTLSRLRGEWKTALAFGPQDPLQIEKIRSDMLTVEAALIKEAQAITDQLNPLAKKRRELEEIAKLQEAGFFGGRDVVAETAARFQDQIARSLKLPDAFSMSMGAQSSGGMVGGAQNIQLDLTRKMLAELGRISNYTFQMAGGN